WKLALGGAELTQEELERLAALKEPLVRLRGQWVELQPDQVDAALRFMAAHANGKMSLGDVLGASLTGQVGDGEIEIEEVTADEWIGDLLGRLRGGDALAEVPSPETLHGTLRPYQQRGLSWLAFLSRYGLGACLADDMGLGKCNLPGTRVSALTGPELVESFWERDLTSIEPDGEDGEWGTLAHPVLVNTFDGREIKAAPVRRVYRQKIAEECVEVRLADGARLSSTRRHRYLTPGGWKMAGELAAGDLVGVPAQTPHIGANEMPPELAELMAWQLSEGNELDRPTAGMFTNSDLSLVEHLRDLAHLYAIRLPQARPHSNGRAWKLWTGQLRTLFKPWGYEWGHKSATKVVPQSILEAPLESQRAFIQALFDAEGHVSKTHCEITMASEQVITALQTMLRNFGIWGRIRRVMKSATNGLNIKRPYFNLTFGGNSVTLNASRKFDAAEIWDLVEREA
ncbi:MAG: SNF2 helicase-associated domain-containing protein, partial [Chloroflexota bacterium]